MSQFHYANLIAEDEKVKKDHYKLWLLVEGSSRESSATYTAGARTNENAGFDLITAEDWVGVPGEPHLLELGVRAMMTRGGEAVHYWLAPRSSIFKTGHIMANSLGVIDASYRGPLKAPVVALAEGAKGFKKGDRHFQIMAPDMGWISEVELCSALPETKRGAGGFGSSGS
jgi:dUTP pyrophosphatase